MDAPWCRSRPQREASAGSARGRCRVTLALLAAVLFVVAAVFLVRHRHRVAEEPMTDIPPAALARLAATQVETATAKLEQGRPDQALALMVSALRADAAAADARMLAERILSETTWHLPILTIAHPLPIEHLAFAGPSSLWVGLSGDTNTLVRWNLETLQIESVLFPLRSAQTRSLVIDPIARRLVVERAGIMLLCDARSLKPIKDLGVLPGDVTPSSVIVFSPDGLLMAHPALVSNDVNSLVWHLRDAASGEILRTTDPAGSDAARALTAYLDRRALHVLHADGSTLEIPVSPVDGVVEVPAKEKTAMLHAQYAADGASAIVLLDQGPHRVPELAILPTGVSVTSLEPLSLLERFPWSRHPGIWSGLLRESPQMPLEVRGKRLDFTHGPHAPYFADSAISAVAATGLLRATGEQNGSLVIHQMLPPAVMAGDVAGEPEFHGREALNAFANLVTALTGLRHDEEKRDFVRAAPAVRLQCLETCDFAALGKMFPRLDFGRLLEARGKLAVREMGPELLKPLVDRLERADPSHPNAATSIAAGLAIALESVSPQVIADCLASAENLPPLLHQLARSRIAWLEGRMADALEGWPVEFPQLPQIRLREDWDGWEQADFSRALEKMRLCLSEELAALQLPEHPTAEDVQSVIGRLTDPETLRSVGRIRLAEACLKASQALISIPDEAANALKLATLASNLGGDVVPCLRAEALALGALGDHVKARDRWVQILTAHPVASHQPTDYTEAAYTSFEAADPAQAVEILTTGLHRFPADVDLALRAGWIALLTGNPGRAYRFLLAGREIGFPREKLEYATALLAVAAAQSGANDDAVLFHEQLITLDPAWQDPEIIEALDWPEEMKSALRQLVW